MGKSNKVHYNLKNVHYAPITADAVDGGFPTYGTPKPIPGAVEMSLDPQGGITKFHADGICYWQKAANNGYEGDITLAIITDEFWQDCLGEELHTTDKVALENVNQQGTAFALLFEFDGDAASVKHVLYNCTATRPAIAGKTVEGEATPDTETMTVSAAALGNGYIQGRTLPETPDSVISNWYKNVYTPTASGEVI